MGSIKNSIDYLEDSIFTKPINGDNIFNFLDFISKKPV